MPLRHHDHKKSLAKPCLDAISVYSDCETNIAHEYASSALVETELYCRGGMYTLVSPLMTQYILLKAFFFIALVVCVSGMEDLLMKLVVGFVVAPHRFQVRLVNRRFDLQNTLIEPVRFDIARPAHAWKFYLEIKHVGSLA